jgi:hypothetical protein
MDAGGMRLIRLSAARLLLKAALLLARLGATLI